MSYTSSIRPSHQVLSPYESGKLHTHKHADSRRGGVISSQRRMQEAKETTRDLKNASSLHRIQEIWSRCGGSFDQIHFATTLSQLRKMRAKQSTSKKQDEHRDFGIFLAKKMENAKLEFNIASIAIISSALEALNIREEKLFRSFADWLQSRSELVRHSHARDLAMIANAFSKQSGDFSELFAQIAEVLLTADHRILLSCNNQDLANITNAFSKQAGDFSELFAQIARSLLANDHRILSSSTSQHLANIANAFSKQAGDFSELFQQIAGSLLADDHRILSSCNSQELANIANAFSKQSGEACELFKQIKKVLLADDHRMLSSCNSQELANIANAFSKQSGEAHELFKQIKKVLLAEDHRILSRCTSQELANIANAFSKQSEDFSELFNQIAESLLADDHRILLSCNSQSLASLANAFSKQSGEARELFNQIAESLLADDHRILLSCNSQSLANLANAFSKQSGDFNELFKQIKKVLLADDHRILLSCNSQSLANLANAFSKQSGDFSELFNQIAESLLADDHCILSSSTSQDLANIVTAFTRVSPCLDEKLLRELFSRILAQVTYQDASGFVFEKYDLRHVIDLLWSFTLTNLVDDTACISNLADYMLDRLEAGETVSTGLFPLHQMRLANQYNLGAKWNEEHAKKLASYCDKNHSVMISEIKIHSSKLQQGVFEIVKKQYPDCTQEHSINGLVVDLFLPKERLVLEANGPSHYIATDKGWILDFPSSFKYALLQATGYKVLDINYSDWDGLKTERAKTEFIEKMIQSSQRASTRAEHAAAE